MSVLRKVLSSFVGAQFGAIVGWRYASDDPLLPVTQKHLRKMLRVALEYSGVSHCPVCGACRHNSEPSQQEPPETEGVQI